MAVSNVYKIDRDNNFGECFEKMPSRALSTARLPVSKENLTSPDTMIVDTTYFLWHFYPCFEIYSESQRKTLTKQLSAAGLLIMCDLFLDTRC